MTAQFQASPERLAPETRLREEGAGSAQTAPLTARQTLMWLDHELYPSAPYHNLVLTIELEGELDTERFADAFAALVADHDALRCRVRSTKSGLLLATDDAYAVKLEHVDLRATPEKREAWMQAAMSVPLSPTERPCQAALLRTGSTSHTFYFAQHHIFSDGSSLVEVCRQMGLHYSSGTVQRGPSMLDYAEVEASYRSSPKGQKDAGYWAQALRGGVPSFALYGIPRTSRSVGVRRITQQASAELCERLVARAGEPPFKSATPDLSRLTVLLTALFAYMYRTTGNKTLAVGIPVRNRPSRFRRSLGLFMEQPFVVLELGDDETIATVADKTRRALFDAVRHSQHTVSERGVPYATLNLHPAIEAEFSGLRASAIFAPAPVRCEHVEGAHGDLRDSVALMVFDAAERGELQVGFELHADTYSQALQTAAQGHFARVLEAVVGDASQRVDTISLPGPSERPKLLEHRERTRRNYERDALAHQLFEREVDRAPEAVALRFRDRTLSYRELDERANQLAHLLRERGVGPDVLVGVCTERSVEMVVSMMAVLKAGGAYVPLDPAYPDDRVAYMLRDSHAKLVIADESSLGALSSATCERLVWTDLTQTLAGYPTSRVDTSGFCASQLMYVIYTSGSTGLPKGVMIEHRNAVNFIAGMQDAEILSGHGVWLAGTSICFDISVLEIFGSLTHGFELVLLGTAQLGLAVDPQYSIANLVERHGVTHFQCTPSQASILLSEADTRRAWGRIKLMLVGGEALSVDLARQLKQVLSGDLINMYGPTETTIWSSTHRVTGSEPRIPLGEPIANTQLYVVDESLQLMPVGVPGELCIAGDGVVRGYLERPELTAQRFVLDPFVNDGKARMYRTGDLARYRHDGTLEFLGRNDFQVKIRGYRIELGEIESALRAHASVHESVVVAREDQPGVKRLVGYVTPAPGHTPDAHTLRAHLAGRLAEYMVPGDLMVLEALPLTPNGKVDRKALPEPISAPSPVHVTPSRELTDTEVRIASLWAALLGKRDVGADEDFFAIGGDSLLAVRLRDRLRDEVGVELPLLALFEHPTVAGMAKSLEEQTAERPQGSAVIALRRSSSDRAPVFCILGLALYRPLALSLATDRPVYGVHVPFKIDVMNLRPTTVMDLAAEYVSAIRKVRPHGPYHIAGLCFGGIVGFETARQLVAAGEQVLSVSLFDATLPRAMHKHRAQQLLHLVKRATKEPLRVAAWIEGRRALLEARVRMSVSRFAPVRKLAMRHHTPATEPAELDVLSPEAEMAAVVYDKLVGPIATEVHLFRASHRAKPPWLTLAPDFGWSSLSPRFSVYDVAAGHLEILQDPAVKNIAAVLDRVLE